MRQAFAGLLWSKQFYHYDVRDWLNGDPAQPPPPAERLDGRNHDWRQLYNADVISMPDKWEYPWYAAWDLAFHCIPLALVDPDVRQAAARAAAARVVHAPQRAAARLRVELQRRQPAGARLGGAARVPDRSAASTAGATAPFLERVFHKLLLNFTWWVNRKDAEGNNIFEGGFLGLDNIGVFDRSKPLPGGGAPRAVRRHELDGDVHAQHAGDRHGARGRGSRLRGHRQQVLGALPLHRPRDDRPRRRVAVPVGRGGRLLLRRRCTRRRRPRSR